MYRLTLGRGELRRNKGWFVRTGVFNLSQVYAFIRWPHTLVTIKLRKCSVEARKNARVLNTVEGVEMISSCGLSLQSEEESPDRT